MQFRLYVMVSVPEAKPENVYASPIILGVFDSKESAKDAWKKRPAEFKDIKSKTVHTYFEVLSSDRETLPDHVYLWASYTAYSFSEDEAPNLDFTPFSDGFYETYEDYQRKYTQVKQQKPISWRNFCEISDFIFHASNENILEKLEINKLARIPVVLTDSNDASHA